MGMGTQYFVCAILKYTKIIVFRAIFNNIYMIGGITSYIQLLRFYSSWEILTEFFCMTARCHDSRSSFA